MRFESVLIKGRATAGKYLDFIGWVVFFSWVVLAFLFKPFPEGVGSIGVGIIVFLVATLRYITSHSVSLNWVFIGMVFVACGVGALMGLDFPFLALSLVLCGILMLTHRETHPDEL
jgi:hypothetical protein